MPHALNWPRESAGEANDDTTERSDRVAIRHARNRRAGGDATVRARPAHAGSDVANLATAPGLEADAHDVADAPLEMGQVRVELGPFKAGALWEGYTADALDPEMHARFVAKHGYPPTIVLAGPITDEESV